MLFSTRGLGDHISGVILYDETLRQKAAACCNPFWMRIFCASPCLPCRKSEGILKSWKFLNACLRCNRLESII